jgi:hypothetical protein
MCWILCLSVQAYCDCTDSVAFHAIHLHSGKTKDYNLLKTTIYINELINLHSSPNWAQTMAQALQL